MQCSNCGKSDRVTIGQKQYCTHCGKALGAADTTPTPSVNVPVRPRMMNDLSAPGAASVLPVDMEASEATEPVAVEASKPTPLPQAQPVSAPNPARAFHGTGSVKGSILDLRHVEVTPPTSSTQATPALITQPANTPLPSTSPVTPAPMKVPVAPEPPTQPLPSAPLATPVMPTVTEPDESSGQPTMISISQDPPPTASDAAVIPAMPSATATHISGVPLASLSARREERLSNAQATSKSEAISKFSSAAGTPGPDNTPAPAPTTSNPVAINMPVAPGMANVPAPAPATLPAAPASPQPLQVAPAAPAPTVSAAATPAPIGPQIIMPTAAHPQAPAPSLPNAVVHEVEKLAKAVPPVGATQSKPTPAPSLKPINTVAVLAAITVLAGYIWVNNYPKMTLHAAAGKAGIEASLPGYVPSSFSLNGPINTSPGQITLNFANPAHHEDLQITQQRTAWDARSLLDNYVAKNHDQYLAVQGQGLTIYIYDQNHASWVNRGIWYNITGSNSLSRDQLLKVAYSL